MQPIERRRATSIALVVNIAVALTGLVRFAPPAVGASPGTSEVTKQIAAGTALYGERCVRCHSANLAGGAGPPLRGEDFGMQWDGKPMRALYSRILMTMPGDDPGSLTPTEVLSLLAYIATENSFASWDTPFKSPDDLTPITLRKAK